MGDIDVSTQTAGYTEDATFYDKYHIIEDLQSKWSQFSARSTDVSIEVIGKSTQGQDITMLRIGCTSATNPSRIFINAVQHAREWAAGMTVPYMADQMSAALAAGRNGDAAALEMQIMLSEVEILIVPISNPDGYNYTRRNRFHRKSMREHVGSPCVGVDLNRNWGVAYGGSSSTSSYVCDDIYIGSGAFSEPEVKALHDVVKRTKGIRAHIDYHTNGGMILGPWSYSRKTPSLVEEWRNLVAGLQTPLQMPLGQSTVVGWGMMRSCHTMRPVSYLIGRLTSVSCLRQLRHILS
jgi:Zinc carboxypeptidase